ncbi:MAG: flagellar biosynthesis anti-sigma factor FlgM [Dehalococcoidia bacterium]|nr:flagellar biosynthesis anti-sigma factor FlgM [Dehalococcoidia bacterium]
MADTLPKPEVTRATEPAPFDDRTRRVMELRRQIREGTYRPDPEAIARALLREWALSGDLFAEPAVPEPADAARGFRAAAERFVVRPCARDGDTPRPAERTA